MNKFWDFRPVMDEAGNETAERELVMNGPISDESWWGDEITPAAFREELNAGSGPITVWINSPGGDVFAASEIYTMLKEYPGKVTVKIDALAASAASVIAMAGDVVAMAPTAMMMIHNPATIAFGDAKEMQQTIEILNEIKESIINAYELKTGLSRAKIARMMDGPNGEGTWMNAYKAKAEGFADEVMYSEDETVAVAAETVKKITENMEATIDIERRFVAMIRDKTQPAPEPEPEPMGRSVDELLEELKNKKR